MSKPNRQSFVMIFALLHLSAVTQLTLCADDRSDFFESSVRPVLVERCTACHGATKQSGGLRVDSLAALLKGGDSGPAIVPGQPQQSLLMKAVQRSEELAMPPEESLSAVQVAALQQWVAQGAAWPADMNVLPSREDRSAADHWAFQPVENPPVPVLSEEQHWVQTPVDAFILQELQEAGLQPAPKADRRMLLRRASYAITGLPPTPQAIADFVNDQSDDAWQRQVDQLLASPGYGEHWGRHWLDVARYADTKGYVYAREERFWVHAWAYRDWVIQALNQDLPYDRFLLLQLAADQVADRDSGDLAAMGFLTLGRRFLGLKHDIIDDRIDVVTRGTMGLTVSCARCHDHKYDPIPTTDYYALYGVFDSCAVQLMPLKPDSDAGQTDAGVKVAAEVEEKRKLLLDERRDRCDAASNQIRDRVAEYLRAQTELHKYPPAGFDQIITAQDLHPRIVSRWQTWLYNADRRQDAVFRAWHAFQEIPEADFSTLAPTVTKQLAGLSIEQLNPVVAASFATPPASFSEVVDRYAKLLTQIHQDWTTAVQTAKAADQARPERLSNDAHEQIRQVLYGPGSPCVIPNEHIANIEELFPSAVVNELWKRQNELDRLILNSEPALPYATALVDRMVATDPRVFRRGNEAILGEPVERRFLTLFADSQQQPSAFHTGSGRRELADAIIDPENPLTARVIVNRAWMHVFGKGLVLTPSDFGLRAERPSHPELLDWLTHWFVDNGWSLKKLHRLLLTSAVFQQTSQVRNEEQLTVAQQLDPDNRLLWHIRPHRLSFEEFRDSLLQASGELETSRGGKAIDLFAAGQPKRRTVYGRIDRQFLPATFRTFDFASPDLHIARRSETTVPQQALFSMNHQMVLDRARVLAEKLPEASSDHRVSFLFQQVLQRDPRDAEIQEALQLIEAAADTSSESPASTVQDWSYGYGAVDEDANQVVNFQAAPHFTGTAWQGGSAWPDPKLGWVNLTAVGGHPGNTRQHACVRRWTAPRDLTASIQSKLTHEPAPGDGIRAFVLSNDQALHAVRIHQDTRELNVPMLQLQKGDVIDFVVDIDEQLNSDQFLWKITISEKNPDVNQPTQWDSEADFTPNTQSRLTPWEQLAHLLLCTNEFMFVD